MNKKLIITSFLIFSSVFVLTGCKKKTEEKIIENVVGNNAEVEMKKDDIKIKTDNGTLRAGDNLSLPEDWPEDLYVPEGNIITGSDINGSVSITMEMEESVADTKKKYDEKLEQENWIVHTSFVLEENVLIGAKKDNKEVNINIAIDEGKTILTLVVNEK